MQTTDNLGLNLPESSDYADITKLNENFQKLDAQALSAQAAKTAPVDADAVPLVDSADDNKTKLITWSNIKAALNNLYAAATHTHAWSAITGKPSSFTPAAHAATHKTGGADAMTASDIGAAASSHTHGNISNTGQISGVTLDSTLVKLVSGALQTLGGTAIDRARIATGSYTGTGAYGGSNPTVINTGLTNAKILLVYHTGTGNFGIFIAGNIRGVTFYPFNTNDTVNIFRGCVLSCSNGTFSFYNTSAPIYQLNDTVGYTWIAIGG